MIEKIGFILLGALLSAFGVFVKALYDRSTHASNRLFEIRLQKLDEVWNSFNSLKLFVGNSAAQGMEIWRETNGEEARKMLTEFRHVIDDSQIVLEADIVRYFRKLDQVYFIYIESEYRDDQNNTLKYDGFIDSKVRPILPELSDAINKKLNARTHRVDLDLTT